MTYRPASVLSRVGDRNVDPDRTPLLRDALVDAVTFGKSSDNGQNCRQYFDRFSILSGHRPSRVSYHRYVSKKVRRGEKESSNRPINGREEKNEIKRFARVKVSFHSERAKIIMEFTGRRRTGEVYGVRKWRFFISARFRETEDSSFSPRALSRSVWINVSF